MLIFLINKSKREKYPQTKIFGIIAEESVDLHKYLKEELDLLLFGVFEIISERFKDIEVRKTLLEPRHRDIQNLTTM